MACSDIRAQFLVGGEKGRYQQLSCQVTCLHFDAKLNDFLPPATERRTETTLISFGTHLLFHNPERCPSSITKHNPLITAPNLTCQQRRATVIDELRPQHLD